MTFSIKQLIHDSVLSEPRQAYKTIRPSALGSCPRVHYWKIKGLEATTPPNLGALMNFKMGYVWEDTVLPLMERVGAKVTTHRAEKWEDKDLNLSGTPDYSVEYDGIRIIVDCKTVNSMWFFYQERAFKAANLATGISKNEFLLGDNESYEIQLGTYLLLAKLNGQKYDHARLLFVNKDNSFIGWEVEVHLTPELETKIYDRIALLNKHLKAGTLPPCECEGWKVGYCDFGQPSTQEPNKKKKLVNTICCPEDDATLIAWSKEKLKEEATDGD